MGRSRQLVIRVISSLVLAPVAVLVTSNVPMLSNSLELMIY